MTYLKSRRFIGAAFTAITMLSITRTITGNGDLTSTVTIAQALVFASPIALELASTKSTRPVAPTADSAAAVNSPTPPYRSST